MVQRSRNCETQGRIAPEIRPRYLMIIGDSSTSLVTPAKYVADNRLNQNLYLMSRGYRYGQGENNVIRNNDRDQGKVHDP